MSESRQRPRQAEVLDALRHAGTPLGVADVARQLGIHANTARFHLDALVANGTVMTTLEPPSGPGRPRTVYRPRPGMDRGGVRGYQLLAQILLSHLSSAGPRAAETAIEAGRAWGGFLADLPPPFRRLTEEAAVASLTALLDDLGFRPEPAAGPDTTGPDTAEPSTAGQDKDRSAVIRLRHCPFLELAEGYEQLVCRVHLGLMRGALAELGAPVTADRLEPFAEPDACLAHLSGAHIGGAHPEGGT